MPKPCKECDPNKGPTFNYPYLDSTIGQCLTTSESEGHKSQVRIDETKCMLSELRLKLNDDGLTDVEWMRVLSFQLNRYIQRLVYEEQS